MINKEKSKIVMKKIINLVAVIMLMIGFAILITPYWHEYQLKKQNNQIINDFIESSTFKTTEFNNDSSSKESNSKIANYENVYTDSVNVNSEEFVPNVSSEKKTAAVEKIFPELYSQMQEYNQKIYEDNQSELRDAFSYTTSDFNFVSYGINDNVVGYITLETLNLKIPLYVGSNLENMSKGATIMNQTSMPIGGINTNCVIAAHRSRGFFGDIESLKINDVVKVTNLWEELSYRVVKIIVIDPYDVDKVKIFPEQDMITLLTCHPYTSNTHRYVVYCVRDNPLNKSYTQDTQSTQSDEELYKSQFGNEVSEDLNSFTEVITYDKLPDGIEYKSSEQSIKNENIVRISGIVFTVLFLLAFIVMFIKNIFVDKMNCKQK